MGLGLVSKLLIATIVITLLSFILPTWKVSNIEAILASATFLYGIFYGFEAAVVLQNFSQLKSLISVENAGLLSIYHMSKVLGDDVSINVKREIVNYLKKAIEYPLTAYVRNTHETFFAIFKPLEKIKPLSEAQSNVMEYMYEAEYYLPQTRSQIAQVSPRDVDSPEWAMLGILGGVIIISLFLSRDETIVSKISAAIFSITVIGSLLLLDEIDSNKIQEKKLEYEVFNDTLEAIGEPRYYPKNQH